MPKRKSKKLLCVDNLRHAEYYGMQGIFDELYSKARSGEIFHSLMDIILKRENILLAYRNIKTNKGSRTAGTDKITIEDIGRLSPEEVVNKVRFIVTGSEHGYRPKPVRRKDIPKPNGKTRPLGIPCMWDRLIQQCIKQVMEPICEAKFSDNSYGFRPNRSVEHAIAATYKYLQLSNLHYVIEFDIKGFFDNVNHQKLIRQIWALGIRDKHLIFVLRRILTAPIKMQDGSMLYPNKGTPQGGIISPLLANIVLNELDHWVESNWQENPVADKYFVKFHENGSKDKSTGYRAMRGTRLKEMYIVRYADDFRVFCRTKEEAVKTKEAITLWLKDRLKLEVSEEKTRIVDVRRRYSEFLGFKIRVQKKGHKETVKSHISDKQLARKKEILLEQARRIAKPRPEFGEQGEIRLYNSMVMGMQEYYCIATEVSRDCSILNRAVMTVLTNRLNNDKGTRLIREGRKLTETEKEKYGHARTLRFVAGTDEPIYPISYIQFKRPMNKRAVVNSYTAEGRRAIHDNLGINTLLMLLLMKTPTYRNSAEFADNRISLFSAQWGKCAVTGKEFVLPNDIHCHHKVPKSKGGSDKYSNLILVLEPVHKLIHATDKETIEKYMSFLRLDKEQLQKVNKLREMAGFANIE